MPWPNKWRDKFYFHTTEDKGVRGRSGRIVLASSLDKKHGPPMCVTSYDENLGSSSGGWSIDKQQWLPDKPVIKSFIKLTDCNNCGKNLDGNCDWFYDWNGYEFGVKGTIKALNKNNAAAREARESVCWQGGNPGGEISLTPCRGTLKNEGCSNLEDNDMPSQCGWNMDTQSIMLQHIFPKMTQIGSKLTCEEIGDINQCPICVNNYGGDNKTLTSWKCE